MEMKDEDLLIRFMNENKHDIADNGFSRRIMRNLPCRHNRFIRMCNVLCAIIGVFLFITFDGFQAIIELLRNMFVRIVQNGVVNIDWKVLAILCVITLIFAIERACQRADL